MDKDKMKDQVETANVEKSPEGTMRKAVLEKYGSIARGQSSGWVPSCCGDSTPLMTIEKRGRALDYSEEDLRLGPGEANLGLGCGNPISMADLKPGEIVLDLGSGAGFDAFLAAERVGASGKVIGVDMTLEMIEKARMNAANLSISSVEFRHGQIERLPVSDSSVHVAISNCVINLAPDKSAVFGEIYRCLKPGGRIVISDILRSGEMPEEIRNNPAAYTG
jgi:SAM-dependent methyltransferase